MSFDISNLHIADNSPEARAVECVMDAQKVGAKEAVLRILRNAEPAERNYIKEGLGLFKSPEDARILDGAVVLALEDRRRPSKRTT